MTAFQVSEQIFWITQAPKAVSLQANFGDRTSRGLLEPSTLCRELRAVDSRQHERVLVENLPQCWSHNRKTSIDNSQCWLECGPVCPWRNGVREVGHIPVLKPQDPLKRQNADSMQQISDRLEF